MTLPIVKQPVIESSVMMSADSCGVLLSDDAMTVLDFSAGLGERQAKVPCGLDIVRVRAALTRTVREGGEGAGVICTEAPRVLLNVAHCDLRHNHASSWLPSFLYALQSRLLASQDGDDMRSRQLQSSATRTVTSSDEADVSVVCTPAIVVGINVSGTGAFDSTHEWIRFFDQNRQAANLEMLCAESDTMSLKKNRRAPSEGARPVSFVHTVLADDEILNPAAAAPLLTAMLFGSLRHLSLRRCLLSTTAMRAMAAGIESSVGTSHCGLESLDVSENDITSDGLDALAAALCKSRAHQAALRVMVLSGNRVGEGAMRETYSRKGLLSLGQLVLRAPKLISVKLDHNELGAAYLQFPAGCDHGGVSEVCEAARRGISCKGVDERRPAVVDLSNNSFDARAKESLSRCSGFTAVL